MNGAILYPADDEIVFFILAAIRKELKPEYDTHIFRVALRIFDNVNYDVNGKSHYETVLG